MSFQSRLGCWWIRLTMKRKPPGEAALVNFTRRRFEPPAWIVALHSLGMNIRRVNEPVKGARDSTAAQQIGREHPKWWVHAGALS